MCIYTLDKMALYWMHKVFLHSEFLSLLVTTPVTYSCTRLSKLFYHQEIVLSYSQVKHFGCLIYLR